MRQGDLSEVSGVAKTLISLYESGKGNPRIDTLERLLVGLGATLGDLERALQRAHKLGPASPRVRNSRKCLVQQDEAHATERALGEFLGFMADIAH